MLKGKKTYIVAALFVVYAGVGFFIGELDSTEVTRLVLEGGGFAALRTGIASRLA